MMKEKTTQTRDLIGDIHGCYDELVALLRELGYSEKDGAFHHPERRTAIFVGDLIDRGPKSREVVQLVRAMVEKGNATVIMGNHEYNFVAYHTPDGNGDYLRPHTADNKKQVRDTLASYEGGDETLRSDLEWMRRLPFTHEELGLRVVHASWWKEDIAFLKNESLGDESFLAATAEKHSRANQAIENVLKGIEVNLPEGAEFPDSLNKKRNTLRVAWWRDLSGDTYREMSFPRLDHLPGEIPPESVTLSSNFPTTDYSPDEPLVFFGHYKLTGKSPSALAPNVACLDYGLGHGGPATAYRWDGESTVDPSHFVQVSG